nr:ribosomal protein S18 [Christella latipinna]WBK27276.1 ribosomal protein S18 [Christella latipinna]
MSRIKLNDLSVDVPRLFAPMKLLITKIPAYFVDSLVSREESYRDG